MNTPGAVHRRPVLYPDQYAWFVLFSALDIILTHTILEYFFDFGGREANTIADWVIRQYGMWGAIGLKFLTVVAVVVLCEVIGRLSPHAGRRLARVIVMLLSLIHI